MSPKVLLLIGTKKGGFIFESDAQRWEWRLREPVCASWPVYHFTADPERGALYAAAGSEWYGAAVWRSLDLGKTWSHSSEGLNYGQSGPDIKTVWSVAPSDGLVYAGVEPAGLFVSEDKGATWQHVSGLRGHPSCPGWMPGGGGLCLHSIVPHPTDPRQVWVAISSAGTFHTADGGATWTAQNGGVRADFMPEKYPEVGQCVHNLQIAPSRP
ncbi:MAG TPA: sialidase family protein, partial [Dehalococcoidia bacterium]|nr:sialidase family protein [Dehalococcoidia bacterium]